MLVARWVGMLPMGSSRRGAGGGQVLAASMTVFLVLSLFMPDVVAVRVSWLRSKMD